MHDACHLHLHKAGVGLYAYVLCAEEVLQVPCYTAE